MRIIRGKKQSLEVGQRHEVTEMPRAYLLTSFSTTKLQTFLFLHCFLKVIRTACVRLIWMLVARQVPAPAQGHGAEISG